MSEANAQFRTAKNILLQQPYVASSTHLGADCVTGSSPSDFDGESQVYERICFLKGSHEPYVHYPGSTAVTRIVYNVDQRNVFQGRVFYH